MAALKAAIGPETAGILLEPIQGEGGIRAFSPSMLREIRDICDEHGLLLVLDEVQSGVGRTGKLFAHEWSGVSPDIMAVAKGIGGGFPLGACLATAEAARGMTAGTHGSTYGGNPLAMACGNAVLDIVADEAFLANVRRVSLLMKQRLAEIKDRHPSIIEEVRGEGLLLGLKARVPNTELAAALRDEHVLAVGAGDNVVRFVPPLVVSDDDVAFAINALDAACSALEASAADKPAA